MHGQLEPCWRIMQPSHTLESKAPEVWRDISSECASIYSLLTKNRIPASSTPLDEEPVSPNAQPSASPRNARWRVLNQHLLDAVSHKLQQLSRVGIEALLGNGPFPNVLLLSLAEGGVVIQVSSCLSWHHLLLLQLLSQKRTQTYINSFQPQ